MRGFLVLAILASCLFFKCECDPKNPFDNEGWYITLTVFWGAVQSANCYYSILGGGVVIGVIIGVIIGVLIGILVNVYVIGPLWLW